MEILFKYISGAVVALVGMLCPITPLIASAIAIINTPPIRTKPNYMRVWEARKADGLDYDESDPAQQLFLAELSRSNNKT